ncbi:hypothetical protein PTSG_12737 [Salpingoeca rosetta]|uniref:Uncharacterized protein n=1 Tax=Salpingoeca rosetta (strain ATCC 50818 / BSB-021) TaxID=946362 RepID=F2UJT7_SALR5|nr:uncharacterized protein PTSG_12737 [Salpingoeca rosetta]EGD77386.1 hypothetical protein PTSG_12737 [Salpingoeca rosetta]|eukprot:XP_004990730.1 hypothetical protein PTSG_12737 [Salpingoeca rosetta]
MQFFKDASPLNRLFFPCKPPGYGGQPQHSPPSSLSASTSATMDPVLRDIVFLGPKGDPCLKRAYTSRRVFPHQRHHRQQQQQQQQQQQPQQPQEHPCIIYFHGNFMDLGDMPYTEMPTVCTRLRATLLVPEYPGYGLALGSASEGGCLRIAEQVIDYAVQNLGFQHNQIVLVGRSIGSGVALQACAHLSRHYGPPLAVVLQSAFTSLRDVARDLTSLGAVLSTRFPNKEVIDSLHITNLLLVHGEDDTLIGPGHSTALFEAATTVANKQLKLVKGATHNRFPASTTMDIISFLEHCTPPPARPTAAEASSAPSLPLSSASSSWMEALGRTFGSCVPMAARHTPCSPSAYRKVPSTDAMKSTTPTVVASSSSSGRGRGANPSSSSSPSTAATATRAHAQPHMSTNESAQSADKNDGKQQQATHPQRDDRRDAQQHNQGASTSRRDKNSGTGCGVMPRSAPQRNRQRPAVVVQSLDREEVQRRFSRQLQRAEEFERSLSRWARLLGFFMPSAPQ